MVGHVDNWVYGGLLNISSMEATQLGKDVIQAVRDSGLLPVLAFPCSAFYQNLKDSFYLHMKGEKNCLSLNGEILGVPIIFAPYSLVKAFPGLRNEGEAPITEKTYTDGWMVMRGFDSQPNTFDNKKSLYEPIDYALADISDRCLLLKSGGHDKITKAQNNVIAVRTNTPLAGRKSEPAMMYHILISHFLCHYTTIANNLNNFTATPVELAKVFDVHDIQRDSNVASKKGGDTIPAVRRRQRGKLKRQLMPMLRKSSPSLRHKSLSPSLLPGLVSQAQTFKTISQAFHPCIYQI